MRSLNHLEQILPSGSHVVFVGLVDGRILWNALHDKQHPLGISYAGTFVSIWGFQISLFADVYEFLNCLGITPCWGWLNKDASIRNQTTAHAFELNKQVWICLCLFH